MSYNPSSKESGATINDVDEFELDRFTRDIAAMRNIADLEKDEDEKIRLMSMADEHSRVLRQILDENDTEPPYSIRGGGEKEIRQTKADPIAINMDEELPPAYPANVAKPEVCDVVKDDDNKSTQNLDATNNNTTCNGSQQQNRSAICPTLPLLLPLSLLPFATCHLCASNCLLFLIFIMTNLLVDVLCIYT